MVIVHVAKIPTSGRTEQYWPLQLVSNASLSLMETSKTWAPISPYFYGQFIEHICYSAREILEVTARLQNGTAG